MLVNLSIRPTPGLSKDDRQQITGFTNYVQRNFSRLPFLLSRDFIYNPFNFLGYQRGTENICSDANLVVLDVDDTAISIQERYQQLSDEGLAFILATTSDVHNMHKYRILFPLDRSVDQEEYRLLVRGIVSNGLVTDMDLSASVKAGGFFFSYLDALVLTHFDGSPLGVSDYAIEPTEVEYAGMGSAELIDSFESEFRSFAATALQGQRTKRLFAVAFRMREAGCSYEQIVTGVLAVNSMFIVSKPVSEVHRRVLSKFIKRKTNES